MPCPGAAISGSKRGSSSDETEIEIQVRDDGAGIAPDILPQIFEPFLTTKESGHGVGLGLAISRGIVERHNGRIEVAIGIGPGHDLHRHPAGSRRTTLRWQAPATGLP